MARRKSLVLLAVMAALAVIAMGSFPAGAVPDPGGAKSGAALSPELKGRYTLDTNGNKVDVGAGDGFPCGNTDLPALDALAKYATGAAFDVNEYPCYGTIFDGGVPAIGNTATIAIAGRDSQTGRAYAFTGTGDSSATYTYSEPCNGGRSLTGEAVGTFTLTLTGSGVIGTTPITSAVYRVNFWWSRVGLTAVVGIRGGTLTSGTLTVTDPEGRGVAAAIFIPKTLPNCLDAHDPPEGDISIVYGSLGVG